MEIIFWEIPERRTAVNVLIGALEQDSQLSSIPLHFVNEDHELERRILSLQDVTDNIVLLVSFATPDVMRVCTKMNVLKKIFGGKLVSIAGGPHPSGDPDVCLLNGFDFVVVGSGETLLVSLLHGVLYRSSWPVARILATKRDGTSISQRDGLDAYPAFAFRSMRFNSIEITRGCPYSCAYCQTGKLHGHKMIHRSVGNVTEHLQFMRKNGLKYVRFITPNALAYGSIKKRDVQHELIAELLAKSQEAIGPEGEIFFGSFPSEIRPEYLDEKIISIMRKFCANKSVAIGAQSGSDTALARMGRQHTSEDVIRAVGLLVSNGFRVDVDLIFGLPGETDDEVRETEKLIDRIIGNDVRIHGHVFMPLPGSQYARAVPGKVSQKVRKLLDRLIHQGQFYGQWERQEAISAQICGFKPIAGV